MLIQLTLHRLLYQQNCIGSRDHCALSETAATSHIYISTITSYAHTINIYIKAKLAGDLGWRQYPINFPANFSFHWFFFGNPCSCLNFQEFPLMDAILCGTRHGIQWRGADDNANAQN